jgi:hypothetical protein
VTTHPKDWTEEEMALRVAYERLPKKTMLFEDAIKDPVIGKLLKIGAGLYLRKHQKNDNEEDPNELLSAAELRRAARDRKGGSPVD